MRSLPVHSQALGMKPKRKKVVEMKSRLDASEMKTLLQRGGPEAAEGEAAAAPNPADPEGEGVRGLGYAPYATPLPWMPAFRFHTGTPPPPKMQPLSTGLLVLRAVGP